MASSRICSIDFCKRSVRALCICCQQYLCIVHLNEHSDLLNAQLTPLATQIDELSDQFNTISLLQPTFPTELDKWREEAHRKVDCFYERKKQEFEEFVHRERENHKIQLDGLRNQVNELIREQEATQEDIDSINMSIRFLRQQTDEIHLHQLTLPSLTVDDRPVIISRKTSRLNNLLPLSPPYRTIKLKGNWCSIAANCDVLLVKQNSKLCLFNRQLIVFKEIPWTHGIIWDMFWSFTLDEFLLITPKAIFTLDEQTMTLKRLSLSGNNDETKWFCGTSSNDNLFLSTAGDGPSIYKYTLLPSIRLVEEYGSPVSCDQHELIKDLSSNNRVLAVVIENWQNKVRLDLCSLGTLERHWSIELASMPGICGSRCCSLINDQWIVIDVNKSELWHISREGKLIRKDRYESSLWHAAQLGNDLLAVMTNESVNLHELS